MKLNISIPFPSVREEVFQMLQEQTMPKYTLVKWLKPIEAQFEVEDDGAHPDLVRHTQHLIHSTKYGKVIMFRVLINGQVFEHGPIREGQKK